VAYYDHYWSDKWSSSIGYSFTRVENTNLQDPSAFRRGDYFSANLLYTPASNIMIGGEVMWGQRTDHDHDTGDDVRFQLSVKYNFSHRSICSVAAQLGCEWPPDRSHPFFSS
jgi:hypothetical protein